MYVSLITILCLANFAFKGPRAQIDRKLYKKHMHEYLKNYPNLTIKAGSVADLILNDGMTEEEYAHMVQKGASQLVKGVRLGKSLYMFFLNQCA